MAGKKTLVLIGLAVTFNFSFAFAQATLNLDSQPDNVSLAGLLQEALQNNPQIKAAQKRYEAAQARVKLLRSVEDPSIEYEYDKIIPEMVGETSPMHSYAVSQNLPFPTKLFLRKESAQKEKEAQKAEYEEKKNEILQKVKEAYFMLSLSAKQVQIAEDTKILLDGLIKTLTNRYSVGQASQQDVLKAQAEYAKLDNQSILFGRKKRIARAMLKALLNRSPGAELAEPAVISTAREITLDKDKIFNLVKERRPELKSYQAALKQAEINYNLAKQEYLPDLMFKYSRREKDGEMGEWTGMFGISFPLWFWDKQAPMTAEAKKEKEAMQAMYQDFENMALYEAEAALAKVESGEKLAKLYETSFMPQAEAAYKAASVGFEAGKNNFLDLLDSERMLLEFKLDYAMSLVDLEIAYAELERSIGMELEKVN